MLSPGLHPSQQKSVCAIYFAAEHDTNLVENGLQTGQNMHRHRIAWSNCRLLHDSDILSVSRDQGLTSLRRRNNSRFQDGCCQRCLRSNNIDKPDCWRTDGLLRSSRPEVSGRILSAYDWNGKNVSGVESTYSFGRNRDFLSTQHPADQLLQIVM